MARRVVVLAVVVLVCIFVVIEEGLCNSPAPGWPEGLHDVTVTSDSVFIAWNKDNLHPNGQVLALDGKTGRPCWHATIPKVSVLAPLVASRELVLAPTWEDGVFVLDAHSGSIKAHLMSGQSGVGWSQAIGPRIILIGVEANGSVVKLEAFDVASFRSLWKRSISWSSLWSIAPADSTFDVLTADPRDMGGESRKFKTLKLRSEDGKIVSEVPSRRPQRRQGVPSSLSKPVRKWMVKLLQAKMPIKVRIPGHDCEAARKQVIDEVQSGTFIPRTNIAQLGDLLFIGNEYDRTAPARLYAVKADTAELVWKQDTPGLWDIQLQGEALFVVRYGTKGLIVTALEARSGRVVWKRAVPMATAHF